MSCNGPAGKPKPVEKTAPPLAVEEAAKNEVPTPVSDAPEAGLPVQQTYKTCEALITDLVKSSNAAALIAFKAVQIRVVEASTGKITIELYTINEVSEDPAVKRMAERTVGWLEFFPATGKLQDITNDPDEPERLQYNTGILQKSGAGKLCLDIPESR